MPTGYTDKVGKGEISLRDYALNCSRAFGALITLRDEPNAPIPDEFLPEPYHKQGLADAKEKLKRVKSMTLEKAKQEAERNYRSAVAIFCKGKKENNQIRRNYESMLEQARNWEPPTKDHVDLRNFMVSQLEESIKFDCSGNYYDELPKRQTGEDYKASLLKSAQRDVTYHQAEYKKEVQMAKERTKWVRALKESLPKK